MPLYEYRCRKCGHQFEKIQTFSAPDEKECPVCKGELERLISAPAIQFKGSGWYVNDYAGKKSAPKSGDSASDGKPAAASADAKPAAPAEKSSAPTAAPSTSKSE